MKQEGREVLIRLPLITRLPEDLSSGFKGGTVLERKGVRMEETEASFEVTVIEKLHLSEASSH